MKKYLLETIKFSGDVFVYAFFIVLDFRLMKVGMDDVVRVGTEFPLSAKKYTKHKNINIFCR